VEAPADAAAAAWALATLAVKADAGTVKALADKAKVGWGTWRAAGRQLRPAAEHVTWRRDVALLGDRKKHLCIHKG
jgi:hypothetical protein